MFVENKVGTHDVVMLTPKTQSHGLHEMADFVSTFLQTIEKVYGYAYDCDYTNTGVLYDVTEIPHKNATLYLFRHHPTTDRIELLLAKRRTDKKWTTPGGRKDPGDQTDFSTMNREFKEETGHQLPLLEALRKLSYDGHTAIFVAALMQHPKILGEPVKLKKGHDKEMIDLRWFDAMDVLGDIGNKKACYLAPRALKSTAEVIEEVRDSHYI